MGHLLALYITPADEQDRAQVEESAQQMQKVTGQTVELAYVDQGYTGEQPEQAAQAHGLQLEVVKLPEAKKGFVLLPRRWVAKRSVALPGLPVSGAWQGSMSACQRLWPGCTIWRSPS